MGKDKDESRTVSIRIDAALRQRLKVYAAKNGTTIQAVAQAAIEPYLEKRGA